MFAEGVWWMGRYIESGWWMIVFMPVPSLHPLKIHGIFSVHLCIIMVVGVAWAIIMTLAICSILYNAPWRSNMLELMQVYKLSWISWFPPKHCFCKFSLLNKIMFICNPFLCSNRSIWWSQNIVGGQSLVYMACLKSQVISSSRNYCRKTLAETLGLAILLTRDLSNLIFDLDRLL